MWIASQRDGHDNAEVTIVRPDGTTERKARASGTATVSDARQFYPGTIQIPATGPYRIEVQVGPDYICVLADFTVPSR